MCWAGSTVHWGTSCESIEGAKHGPRASMALVFRRAGATLAQPEKSLTRAEVSQATLTQRLGWVKSAITFFEHWHPGASADLRVPGE